MSERTTEEIANVYESAWNDTVDDADVYEVMDQARSEFYEWLRGHDAALIENLADDIAARANGEGLIRAADRWGGYYAGVRTSMQDEEQTLRAHAAKLREGQNNE